MNLRADLRPFFFIAHWDHEPDLHKSLNDECRMSNVERSPKPECAIARSCAVAGFVIRISSFLRISSFVIRVSESRFMERERGLNAPVPLRPTLPLEPRRPTADGCALRETISIPRPPSRQSRARARYPQAWPAAACVPSRIF